MSKMPIKFNCGCNVKDHVDPMNASEADDDDEGSDREWEAHTQAYRDEWTEMYNSLNMNSTDGEIFIEKWIRDNHDKLCCIYRHSNRQIIWNF